jgi:hypothetical protein
MNNPGVFNLGDRTITAALTDQVITEASGVEGAQSDIRNLAGMTGVTIEAKFVYGSGGTTCLVTIQTSLNQGTDWIDVARLDFATANARKTVNLSAAAAAAVAAVAALSAEGKVDGVLGDRLRAKVTSTGVYAGNTSISVRAAVR